MAYLLGIDIGSSSVKAALMEVEGGMKIAVSTSPDTELPIQSPQSGWAEQEPEVWWTHVKAAIAMIKKDHASKLKDVKAIGISYQMHGLVMVDKNGKVLYPAIIWCDSRAVAAGDKAFNQLGSNECLTRLLNSPGNFTASKLKWVKDNLPEIYSQIDKIMLPGDYIAYRLSNKISTTITGLSEGIFWDFKDKTTADFLLNHYGIPKNFLPEIVDVFSVQAGLSREAADELGLTPGLPISYRAGDQPNNAFSLNVLEAGELAATAGTSGVVYAVSDKPSYDLKSRVNTFAHVNYSKEKERLGTLLCLNGTGILYSWLRKQVFTGINSSLALYSAVDQAAESVPVGSEGLVILPFGNGAERSLENKNLKAFFHGLEFNVHAKAHMARAALEGIVFALNYGIKIMRDMGIKVARVKAGNANLFKSSLFCSAFACTTGAVVEICNTDGSMGAARGAGLGAGIYKSREEAFSSLDIIRVIQPDLSQSGKYKEAYERWENVLKRFL